MKKRVSLIREDKSASAKIEYLAILAALVVGVPLVVTQVPRFIEKGFSPLLRRVDILYLSAPS